jgi:hypothetical protein
MARPTKETQNSKRLAKALETDIDAERQRSVGPLRIWDREVDRPCPSGGAILHVRWAVGGYSYDEWYPTIQAANAALEILAAKNGRQVDRSNLGYSVDLTLSGCHSSSAWVTLNA